MSLKMCQEILYGNYANISFGARSEGPNQRVEHTILKSNFTFMAAMSGS